jgi:hypothetical protein
VNADKQQIAKRKNHREIYPLAVREIEYQPAQAKAPSRIKKRIPAGGLYATVANTLLRVR